MDSDDDDDEIPHWIKCEELRFISKTLDWGPRMHKDLKKNKIATLNALCRKRTQVQEMMNQTDDSSQKDRLKQAIDIARFRERIQKVHGKIASMIEFFSSHEFSIFKKNQERDMEESVDKYLFGNGPIPDDLTEENIDQLTTAIVRQALEKLEPDCRNQLKACHFRSEDFVRMLVRCRLDGTKYVVVDGRTQLGKSNVKCLVHGVANLAKTGVIVVTKGNTERDELSEKIKNRVVDRNLIINASTDWNGIADILKAGGMAVAAQTEGQIRKTIRSVQKCQREDPNFNFVVVLDEADTMFRSREEDEAKVKVEQAYRDLLKLSPRVVVMISATVVPVLLHIVDKKELDRKEVKFFQLKPNDDYVSIDMLLPPKDKEGDVYLDETLRFRGGDGITIGTFGSIPFTDPRVKDLYDLALEVPTTMRYANAVPEQHRPKRMKAGGDYRRGVLLLDITDPRVNATGNVFEKARTLQDAYYLTEGQKFVAVVIVGSGIYTRRDHGSDWVHEDKHKTISEVIQSIDERDGLDTPIFVFGFSKMSRGLSFRSDRRVPTHIIVSRGLGYAVDDVCQTLGRGTFNGKVVLEGNGFQQVTVLATYQDLTSARKYVAMTDHFDYRLRQGDSVWEALAGAQQTIPDYANFVRNCLTRKIGQGSKKNAWAKKVMKETGVLNQDAFAPAGSDSYLKGRFWHNEEAQKLLGVISRMWKNRPTAFELGDMELAYFDDRLVVMNQREAKALLKEFCACHLLRKVTINAGAAAVWSVLDGWAFDSLLNPETSGFVSSLNTRP